MKLNNLIELDLQIKNKYKDINDCPNEVYKQFRTEIEKFILSNGLKELNLLLYLREYDLLSVINSLVFRIVDKLDAEDKKNYNSEKSHDLKCKEILFFKEVI